MENRHLLVCVLLSAGLAVPSLVAAEPSGKAIAFTCAACHGTDGRSQGVIPSINGEEADELYEELLEFKSGEEQVTIMNRIASGYSDSELRAVAEYLETIEE